MKRLLMTLGVVTVLSTGAATLVAAGPGPTPGFDPPSPVPTCPPEDRSGDPKCPTPTPSPCPTVTVASTGGSGGPPKDCPTPSPTPPTPTPTTPPPTTPPPPPPPPSPTPPPGCGVELGPWYGDPRINIDLIGPGHFVVRGGIQRFTGLRRIVVDVAAGQEYRVNRYKVAYGDTLRVLCNGVLLVSETPPRV